MFVRLSAPVGQVGFKVLVRDKEYNNNLDLACFSLPLRNVSRIDSKKPLFIKLLYWGKV
jgi:hypothetical protein